MTERKYSVAEIDAMRRSLDRMRPCGSMMIGEWEKRVEDRLRTHMLNGTEPEELAEAAQDFALQQVRHREVELEMRRRISKTWEKE